MKSFHVRRNFLKLAKRIGLISFSAFGAGTVVNLSTAQSAQSKQISDSEQMQELLDRVTNLEQKLVQRPTRSEARPERVNPSNIEKPPKIKVIVDKENLNVGGGKQSGRINIHSKAKDNIPNVVENNPPTIVLDGEASTINVGGHGLAGILNLKTAQNQRSCVSKAWN